MNKKMRKYASAKIKRVTLMPGWLLKFKGRWDSRKGDGVCDEFLKKLTKKAAAIEAMEAIKAESVLHGRRKLGGELLLVLSENREAAHNKPELEEVTSPKIARKNNQKMSAHINGKNIFKEARKQLSEINEDIIFVDTVLSEKTEKLHSQTIEKFHAYVSGVRAGKLPDYTVKSGFDSKASDIYHAKHAELDTMIHNVVSDKMREVII